MNTVITSTRQDTPHKSTTHEELFFHVENDGTVFFRKENDGKWYGSIAMRSKRDQFCRKVGRCVARRKYFQGKRFEYTRSDKPAYYTAAAMITLQVMARIAREERNK